MRILLFSAIICLLLLVGCRGLKKEDIATRIPENIAQAKATVESVSVNAKEATKNLIEAQKEVSLVKNESLLKVTIPKLAATAQKIETIQGTVPDLLGTVEKLSTTEKELVVISTKLKNITESTKSGIKTCLIWIGVISFLGIAGSIAIFIWLNKKAGLAIGSASLLVFILSITFYQYFDWLVLAGLILIGFSLVGLITIIVINRKVIVELITGNQNVKNTLQQIMETMEPNELLDFVKKTSLDVKSKFREMFNSLLKDEQSPTTTKIVEEVKNKEGL
jgi:hypothetical protein